MRLAKADSLAGLLRNCAFNEKSRRIDEGAEACQDSLISASAGTTRVFTKYEAGKLGQGERLGTECWAKIASRFLQKTFDKVHKSSSFVSPQMLAIHFDATTQYGTRSFRVLARLQNCPRQVFGVAWFKI